MIEPGNLDSLLADARALRDRALAIEPVRDENTETYLARPQSERDFVHAYGRAMCHLAEAVIIIGKLRGGNSSGALEWTNARRRSDAESWFGESWESGE